MSEIKKTIPIGEDDSIEVGLDERGIFLEVKNDLPYGSAGLYLTVDQADAVLRALSQAIMLRDLSCCVRDDLIADGYEGWG